MINLELSFVTEYPHGLEHIPLFDGGEWIRWFSHSDFSHVDIIQGGMRFGARSDYPVNGKTGVQIRPMDYAVFRRDERVVIPAFREPLDCAVIWLNKQVGKPYDTTGLFRSFLFDDMNWRTEDRWWCSELGTVYVETALNKRVLTAANRMTPNDLYLWAGAQSGVQSYSALRTS